MEQAKKFVRLTEAIQQQQSILKSNSDPQIGTLEPMYVNKATQGKRISGNPSQITRR